MMGRRGQTAVEFLTTYSWAIFILFGVVSAVYMLDLADPDRYADPECVLDNQVSCLEAQYRLNGSDPDLFRMNLQNNYPKEIRVTQLNLSLESGTINDSEDLNGGSGYVIGPGEQQVVSQTIEDDWSQEGYVSDEVATNLDIDLAFEPTDSGNQYKKSGYAIVRAIE